MWSMFMSKRHIYFALFVAFQGKSEEAQRVQMQALHVYEKALGPEHPSVAIACDSLALYMQDQVT